MRTCGHRTPDSRACCSSRFARALSAHDAGCAQEARYTAADMSVLWGGGNPATPGKTGRSRTPYGRHTVGAAVTRNAQTGITRQLAGRLTAASEEGRPDAAARICAARRRLAGWPEVAVPVRCELELLMRPIRAGRVCAQRERSCTAAEGQSERRSSLRRADRMESLKARKAGPRPGASGEAAQVALAQAAEAARAEFTRPCAGHVG
jgi:hypothetical protein